VIYITKGKMGFPGTIDSVGFKNLFSKLFLISFLSGSLPNLNLFAETPSHHLRFLIQFQKLPPTFPGEITRITEKLKTLLSDPSLKLLPLPVQNTYLLSLSIPRSEGEIQPFLKILPSIVYFGPPKPLHPFLLPNDPQFPSSWGLKNIGQTLPQFPDENDGETVSPTNPQDKGKTGVDISAEPAWDLVTTSVGITIAVLDTGVDPNHPDLKENLFRNPVEIENNLDDDGNGYIDDLWGWDACKNNGKPYDLVGHGTAVAGVIGAKGNNNFGSTGVLWKTTIVPIRVLGPDLDPDCNNTLSAILGLEYARKVNAKVINLSFGGKEDDPPFRQKIEELLREGRIIVAAAGNEGTSLEKTPFYPAAYSYPTLLAVGAHTNSGYLSIFSNYGPTVRISAPGVNIFSTLPSREDFFQYRNFSQAPTGEIVAPGRINGTSFTATFNPIISRPGIALLTTGEKIFVLDLSSARNNEGYRGNQELILTTDPINPLSFQSAVIHFNLAYEMGPDGTIAFEYSTDGGIRWNRLPAGKGIYGPNATDFVEEIWDLKKIIPENTSDLRIRFLFRSQNNYTNPSLVIGGGWLWDVEIVRPGTLYDGTHGKIFGWENGTSFASPFVAGAIGALLTLYPNAPPEGIIERILLRAETLNTTQKIPGDRRLHLYGAVLARPTLNWVGSPGYERDGVEPDTIPLGGKVTFKVQILFPTELTKAVVEWGREGKWSQTPLNPETSKIYFASIVPPSPGRYSYRFLFYDSEGALPGEPTQFKTFFVTPPPEEKGCGCAVDPEAPPPFFLFLLFIFLSRVIYGRKEN
jgi:subtilisin family serine protease